MPEGPCLNVFRRWSGEPVVLEPLPDASDALQDIRRRIAALLRVGTLQIRLSCGNAELAGLTLGQALHGSGQDVFVSVQSASVYRRTIDLAKGSTGLLEQGRVEFPKFQGIDINMMPFVMGDRKSLPEEYHSYWPMIQQCVSDVQRGEIGYLTLQESDVAAGASQRRPGLHLEAPGWIKSGGGAVMETLQHWGGGHHDEDMIEGGLFTASTVGHSCRAWNMKIEDAEDVVGPLGNAEHLRELLEEEAATFLSESTLYWMTDCTPHESMPLPDGTRRQYFRLVTSAVSIWYAKHSTANPLGIMPNPNVTRILTVDKFADRDRRS